MGEAVLETQFRRLLSYFHELALLFSIQVLILSARSSLRVPKRCPNWTQTKKFVAVCGKLDVEGIYVNLGFTQINNIDAHTGQLNFGIWAGASIGAGD